MANPLNTGGVRLRLIKHKRFEAFQSCDNTMNFCNRKEGSRNLYTVLYADFSMNFRVPPRGGCCTETAADFHVGTLMRECALRYRETADARTMVLPAGPARKMPQ